MLQICGWTDGGGYRQNIEEDHVYDTQHRSDDSAYGIWKMKRKKITLKTYAKMGGQSEK
jgi:hypothetical protein